MTGYAQMHGSRKDYVTIKYGNNGGVKWNRPYNGTSGDDDKPKALALDAEENVYVTGESDGLGTNKDYATVKYLGETGHEEWVHTENGAWSGDDVAQQIVVGKHGRVYVTGTVHGGNGDKNGTEADIFTTSYRTDKKAKPAWESVFNGPILRGSDAGFAITSDNDGNIIVVGQSDTGKSHDIVVLKYAP